MQTVDTQSPEGAADVLQRFHMAGEFLMNYARTAPEGMVWTVRAEPGEDELLVKLRPWDSLTECDAEEIANVRKASEQQRGMTVIIFTKCTECPVLHPQLLTLAERPRPPAPSEEAHPQPMGRVAQA